MYAMNLVDSSDSKVNYGILICNNDAITLEAIQDRMVEIKEELFEKNLDWVIEDVVSRMPMDWNLKWQSNSKQVRI